MYLLRHKGIDVRLATEASLVIGRDPRCDLLVDDVDCSRQHARLWVRDGVVWIEDLGSQNGVLVQGVRIAAPTQVPAGSAIRLGKSDFLLRSVDAAAGLAARGTAQQGDERLVAEAEKAQLRAAAASNPAAKRSNLRRAPAVTPSARLGRPARLLVTAASWSLSCALVFVALSLPTEVGLLLAAEVPLRSALAAWLAAGALGTLLGLVGGLYLGSLSLFSSRLYRHRRWPRALGALPIALASGAAGWCLAVHHASAHAAVLSAGACAALVSVHLLGRSMRRGARVVLLVIGQLGLLADVLVPASGYRELHDGLGLIAVASLLLLLRPVRRRVMRLGLPAVGALMALLAVTSLAAVQAVDSIAPGWRSAATTRGRYADRLGRAARALIDFDADGFSPIAWGGDCDDFDARRNPMARDAPGRHDANCNGIDPPLHPTDSERGLGPPVGEPQLGPDQVDLVLLLTIDSLRYDALRPDIMPRVSALAREGTVFSRMYSAGSRTLVGLITMQVGCKGAQRLARRVAAAGVSTTVMFSLALPSLAGHFTEGFQEVQVPRRGRWNAQKMTQLALADLRAHAHDRHYLWVHYLDPHFPYKGNPDVPPPPQPPGVPLVYRDYLSSLGFVDQKVGEIVDELRRTGRLARTVIILTADHGEGFGEHDVLFHTVSAYEPLVHVPALVIAPGLPPSRHGGLASHRDVYPTVLGAFGLLSTEPHAEDYGRSLLRLRGAPAAELHRFAVIRSARFSAGKTAFSPLIAIVDGRHKLVQSFEGNLFELYDLVNDPDERHDLFSLAHPAFLDLAPKLALFRDIDSHPPWSIVTDVFTEDLSLY